MGHGRVRGWSLFSSAALLAVCNSGCAATDRYHGISLRTGAAPVELQTLAEQARRGDKQAQLALGIRYQEGRGVPVDYRRARQLYRLAGADSGGVVYIYQAPVRKGASGRVAPLHLGPVVRGLPEAVARLRLLRTGGADAD